MITINGEKIKNRESIQKLINSEKNISEIYLERETELLNILKLNNIKIINKDIFLKLCLLARKHKKLLSNIVKDLEDIGETFDIDRYSKYLLFRENNKFSNTLEAYILKYGEEIGVEKRNNSIKGTTEKSPYKIEHWLNKGFSVEEAKEKIKEYKTSKATSIDGFIKRHGLSEGVCRFNEFQNSSKHTKDKYIKLYGLEEGAKKWNEFINLKGANSVFKKDYWVNKGYDEETAESMRKEFHNKNLNVMSVDYWELKGFSEKQAIEKIRDIEVKRGVKYRNASKQSLRVFKPVIKHFENSGLKFKIGITGNNELALKNINDVKYYYYDFVVPELNLIFEFNGEKFHPHPSITNLAEWQTIYLEKTKNGSTRKKLNGFEVREKDINKQKLAESHGYKYYVIWSRDNVEESINNIIKIIENENKKNK